MQPSTVASHWVSRHSEASLCGHIWAIDLNSCRPEDLWAACGRPYLDQHTPSTARRKCKQRRQQVVRRGITEAGHNFSLNATDMAAMPLRCQMILLLGARGSS